MAFGLMRLLLAGMVCTGAIAAVVYTYESKRSCVCEKSGLVSMYPIENDGGLINA